MKQPLPVPARRRDAGRLLCVIVACLLGPLLAVGTAQAEDDAAISDRELAKKSQNPIGQLIAVPLENNLDYGVGPEDAEVYVLNLKPVYPLTLGEHVNLLNRFTIPIIAQGERIEGEGSEAGLGNITYQAFFSPRSDGRLLWGVGPALALPSRSDSRFGSRKWALGPALVALAKPGPWLVGALVQQSWSFAGEGSERSVDSFSLQYFINYNLDGGWYLTSTPTMAADWNADSSDTWTIPVGGGIGRLVRIGGKLPIDIKLQGFYNVEKPKLAGRWSTQLQLKFLFPK